MRRLLATAFLTIFAVTQMGCFTTRVASGIPPSGPTYEERQWFAIAGLISLSGAAGNECRNGVAWAESQYSLVDAALILALTAGGWLAAGYACSNSSGDPSTFGQCASAGATLVPLLLQPRTVRYGCLGTGAAAAGGAPSIVPVASAGQ